MANKKIALYGGSFDPIHNGHLHVACSAVEKLQLDLVLFCPAAVSPHKLDSTPHASKQNRLHMINHAIAPFPYFALCEFEIHQEGPSYTVDTLEYLSKRYIELKENVDLFLLIGHDCIAKMDSWKKIDTIHSLATVVVAPRQSSSSSCKSVCIQHDYIDLGSPSLDISSSWIRHRVKKELPITYLVPRCAEEYIYEHKLYKKG
jgi:nicotinate-nucleotide adenylyltransferase